MSSSTAAMWLEAGRELLHHTSWAILLGAQVFESFVVVKLAFRHLPRRAFAELQRHLFPTYFRLQTGLAAVTLASSVPFEWISLRSLGIDSEWSTGAAGAASAAISATSSSKSFVWLRIVPLGVVLICSVLNERVFGPQTSALMMQRLEKPQEDSHAATSTTTTSTTTTPASSTPKPLNARFRTAHAMSIHLNAIALVGTAWAGLSFVAL